MEHVWPDERAKFEVKSGVTYCRRCGRPIAKDGDPGWSQSKSCQVVEITLRGQE